MNPNPELETAVANTLQKLGRNIVSLQKMEQRLKFILLFADLEYSPSNFKMRFESRKRRLKRRGMGVLVDEAAKVLYAPKRSAAIAEPSATEFTFRLCLGPLGGADEMKRWRKEMGKVVRERNRLVHEMAASFDKSSAVSCQKLSDALDIQRERMHSPYCELESLVEDFMEFLREVGRGNYDVTQYSPPHTD